MSNPCSHQYGAMWSVCVFCADRMVFSLKAADALAKAIRYCKDHKCNPWPCVALNDALAAYEKVRGLK